MRNPMPREFKPSPQQAAYFAWVETGTGSCVLEAVAGAGKTTTLLRSTKMMPGNVAFMAYGNAAAKDIRAKADEGGYSRPDMRIGTVHSFCNKAWRYMAPDLGDPDENKVPNIIASLIEQATPEQAAKLESWKHVIKRLVSVGKSFLMGVPDMANPQVTRQRAVTNLGVWAKLAEHFSVFDDLPEDSDTTEILKLVVDVFEVSASMCRTVIDFDDMIYAPLRFRARFFKQDWVLGDEWQDANPARREAVRRMLKPGGRAIFVGDSRQAIFGFTGAGADSLERTAAEFNCTRLPLTITYRCPKTVVSYLHQWVSHIEAHPDAPVGFVGSVPMPVAGPTDKRQPWFLSNKPEPTDAILCRYNKPLVDTAFAMLKAGIACQVEGRDIGKNLITLSQRWKVTTLDALDKKLDIYLSREVEKARKVDNERKEQMIQDQVETLRVFIGRCREKGHHELSCVVAEIKALFADDVRGVTTLCSGHKSKGREWGRVYWLQHTLKCKRALKPWEAVQEANISYVIGSRVEGVHGAGELWLVSEELQKIT